MIFFTRKHTEEAFIDISPVIITGMHRSGTSVLTSALGRLGLFTGRDIDQNNESTFFQEINKWIFDISGGRWDNPKPATYLFFNSEYQKKVKYYVSYLIDSPRICSYTGIMNFILLGTPVSWKQAWGWKDPRNTILLPLWKKIFPNARIVHIRRHGVDVSRSLKKRTTNMYENGSRRFDRKMKYLYPIYWARLKQSGFGGSVRLRSFENAFSLWYYYIRAAIQNTKKYHRVIDLKYEELVCNPQRELNRLAEFCDLEVSSDDIKKAANMFDSSRSFAYRSESFSEDLSSKMKDQLRYAGYEL